MNFEKYNVLIGKNGSGKSNFIRGVFNSLAPFNHNYKDYDAGQDNSSLFKSEFLCVVKMTMEEMKEIQGIFVSRNFYSSKFDNQKTHFEVRLVQEGLRLNCQVNQLGVDKQDSVVYDSPGLGKVTASPAISIDNFGSFINIFFLNENREIPHTITAGTGQNPSEYEVVNALIDMKMNDNDKYISVMEKAKKIFPDLEGLIIKIDKGFASFSMKEKELEGYVPIKLVSKGLRELLILLITLEYAPSESVVLIEEPEIHLHPSAIKELKETMLNAISEKKLQIIISTHSPLFLSDVYPETQSFAKFIQFKKMKESHYTEISEIKSDKDVGALIQDMEMRTKGT